jgi:hypothetical protein
LPGAFNSRFDFFLSMLILAERAFDLDALLFHGDCRVVPALFVKPESPIRGFRKCLLLLEVPDQRFGGLKDLSHRNVAGADDIATPTLDAFRQRKLSEQGGIPVASCNYQILWL